MIVVFVLQQRTDLILIIPGIRHGLLSRDAACLPVRSKQLPPPQQHLPLVRVQRHLPEGLPTVRRRAQFEALNEGERHDDARVHSELLRLGQDVPDRNRDGVPLDADAEAGVRRRRGGGPHAEPEEDGEERRVLPDFEAEDGSVVQLAQGAGEGPYGLQDVRGGAVGAGAGHAGEVDVECRDDGVGGVPPGEDADGDGNGWVPAGCGHARKGVHQSEEVDVAVACMSGTEIDCQKVPL